MVVGENIMFVDLKGILIVFVKIMFGEECEICFCLFFFLFIELFVEMDIFCFKCGGKGCCVCKGIGWIEILGSGMVYLNVFEMLGIDFMCYSGFVFGLGFEWVVMLKYVVDDICYFYINDLCFMK